jgi:preprotein translocase subunit SecA
VVAQAGRKGAITVSTNMAGRGTDIILGGNAEMLAKLEFKEQGRDSETDKEDFEKLVLKYEKNCKREGDEVREAGGLHIVGTERHESRRIDNQLRGRAGRQGDPGSSRFYVSFEDDLMRIFGGDRLKSFMGILGMPDDEPIEHPRVSKTLQDAQRKVEARNFDIRKNLLEYDDVMNEQRKTVYKIRQQLLLGIYKPEIVDDDGKPTGTLRKIAVLPRLVEEVKPGVTELMLHFGTGAHANGASDAEAKHPTTIQEIEEIVDMEALRVAVYNTWGVRYDFKEGDGKKPEVVFDHLMEIVPMGLTEQRERLLDLVDQIISAVVEESCPLNKQPDDWDWKGIRSAFVEHFGKKPENDYEKLHDPQDLAHALYSQAFEIVDEKEKEMGTELWLRIFRHFYLEDIDKQWVEHLTNMEHLRDGIGLRGYGQRDPKQEYKKEGYDLFVNMMAETSSNVITKLMEVRVQKERDVERLESANAERHAAAARSMQLRHGSEPAEGDEPRVPEAAAAPARRAVLQPARRTAPKIGRNDLCPCGSGEKFKKCHGAALEDESSSQS